MTRRLNPGPDCTKWEFSVIILCVWKDFLKCYIGSLCLLKIGNTKKGWENRLECRERLHKNPTALIFKACINGFNICPTFVQQKLNGCWTNVERSVQTASTPLNIFKKKGNVVWILNESLSQFKFGSTSFQDIFTLSTMLNDLLKRP